MDFDDLNLGSHFDENVYPKVPESIKSSREKDAILYQGYYYNHHRAIKKSIVYKCRENFVDKNGIKKQCVGALTVHDKDENDEVKYTSWLIKAK